MVPPREKHRQRWKEVEDRRLREFVESGLPTRVIAQRMGRTTLAVRTRAHHLGITLGGSAPDGGTGQTAPETVTAFPPDRAA
jgi:hypothetical protein